METVDRLCSLLPEAEAVFRKWRPILCEVRLRANRRVQLRGMDVQQLVDPVIGEDRLQAVLASLMDHSVYAREAELGQGYFTLGDGSRVGVCGRLVFDGLRVTGMAEIGSACIRLSRAVDGGAGVLLDRILDGKTGTVRSTLILSRPGMGKTTCLRQIARRLSEAGLCVAVADERHELAACRNGAPTLDVGPCTDVMDGGPKRLAIARLLRSVAPQVIVADEIGDAGDARALSEAVRCGVAVITSAHADSLSSAMRRPGIAQPIREGIFSITAVLDSPPGMIREIHDLEGWEGSDADFAGDVRRGGMRALRAVHGRRRAEKERTAGSARTGDRSPEASDGGQTRIDPPCVAGGGMSTV